MPHLPVRLDDLADVGKTVAKWAVLVVPLGMVTGSCVAGFLWSLDRVTVIRFEYPWLLWTPASTDPKSASIVSTGWR